MILFFENYDSFSNNIIRKIFSKGLIINIINFSINSININKIIEKFFILGPGPSNPFNCNLISLILDKFLGKKNFLGICLGHQIICCYFGSKIYKLNLLKHGQNNFFYFFFKKYKLFFKKKFIMYNSLSCIDNKIINIIGKYKDELSFIKNLKIKIKSFQFHLESFFSDKNILI